MKTWLMHGVWGFQALAVDHRAVNIHLSDEAQVLD